MRPELCCSGQTQRRSPFRVAIGRLFVVLLLTSVLSGCGSSTVRVADVSSTVAPSATATILPTRVVAPTPTLVPTVATPTVLPTATPTLTPTETLAPTNSPTLEPTETPTLEPTASPTLEPTATLSPTAVLVLPTLPIPTPTVVIAETPILATPTQELPVIPTATVPVSVTEVVAPIVAGQYMAHKVVPGETLQSLARSGMTAEQIQAYNHLHTTTLRPGQPLIIPATDGIAGERVLVQRGNPTVARVAITLDAGASAVPTPAMLKALHERGIHVTFFLTGQWMREHPDLTFQIAAEGHEIANHSFRHPDFTTLDAAAMLKELADTDAAAQALTGHGTRPFFRPPYGAYNNSVLDTVIGAGYLPIYWTLDSLDSVGKPKTPKFLIDRVTTKLKGADLNGAIFLMHCGSEATAAALPVILDRFAAMGVSVTTVGELLGP